MRGGEMVRVGETLNDGGESVLPSTTLTDGPEVEG